MGRKVADIFTAAQAAQKTSSWPLTHLMVFTAAQAAQKGRVVAQVHLHPFTAAQAAQKTSIRGPLFGG